VQLQARAKSKEDLSIDAACRTKNRKPLGDTMQKRK
jgi:hypothetical protein